MSYPFGTWRNTRDVVLYEVRERVRLRTWSEYLQWHTRGIFVPVHNLGGALFDDLCVR